MALTTLANVKEWLKIPALTTTNDALLTRLIDAASAYIESWCERTFALTAYTEVRNGTGSTGIAVRQPPIVAVTQVKIDQVLIPASSLGLSGWIISAERPNIVQLRGYTFWRGIGNVDLAYSAGYATTPKDVEQACIEMVGTKFLRSNENRVGVSSKSLADQSITFSQVDMGTEVKNQLHRYQRGFFPT